jgi:hypothetical protein
LRWLLAAAAALAVGCQTARTEIVVVVSSDLGPPDELDQVLLVVESEHQQQRFEQTYDVGPGKTALPFSLALVPDRDRSVAFHVTATGLSHGARVVERSATTSFVPALTLALPLDLLRVCKMKSCIPGWTCGDDGQCAPDRREGKNLPRLGQPVNGREAGSPAGPAPDGATADTAPGPGPDAGSAGLPADAGSPADPTLRARYLLDEGMGTTLRDSSMYANQASAGNPVWVPGVTGSALRFETIRETAGAPDSPSLNPVGTELTLEVWMKPTMTLSAYRRPILSKGEYSLYLQTPGVTSIFCGGGPMPICANAQFPVGVWKHYAATLGSGTLRLYINGVEVASAPNHGERINGSTSALTIGGYPLSADLDDVRIYARARTAAEICADAMRTWTGSACM